MDGRFWEDESDMDDVGSAVDEWSRDGWMDDMGMSGCRG